MRVRFLSLGNPLTIAKRNFLFSPHSYLKEGQITVLPDNVAKEYIEEKIVEPFNYSINDNSIIQLHKDFTQASEFYKKVEIFIFSLSRSFNKAVLKDGKDVVFKLTPENPDQWLQFNSLLIKYYKNEFPDCSLEGLIQVFNKRKHNSPNVDRLIDLELLRINNIIEEDIPQGINYWYIAANNGDIPKQETEFEKYISKPIHPDIKLLLQGKAIAEYKAFLTKYRGKDLSIEKVIFKISNIDVPRLVADLENRGFFDPSYKKDVLAWFNGTSPKEPIPMNVSSTKFISLIADLMDKRPKLIYNYKEFVYTYIESSFLFNGRKPEISTIKQIMKPSSKNRVSYNTKTIPNIQDFKN